MTKAKINGTELKISEREPLLAGSVGINRIRFEFSADWSGLTRQIDFTNTQSGDTRRISAQDAVCTVPWEVLRCEGDVSCYIRGIGADGKLKLRTNDANLGTVLGTAAGSVPGSETPTPDVCDVLAAKLGNLAELETSEKSQLVGAINEVKNSKQDKLTAGDNITIAADGRTISATGGGAENAVEYFEVTLTDDGGGTFIGDKTFEQVKAAIDAGKLYLKATLADEPPRIFSLVDVLTTKILFVTDYTSIGYMFLAVFNTGSWAFQLEQRIAYSDIKELSDRIGSKYALKTTDQTSTVAAINELKAALDAVPDSTVTEQTVSGWGFTKNTGTYSKPAGGILKADLASAVQTSLGKADTALQSVPGTYRTASAQDAIDNTKVDKVTGKGLSTNDYTAAAKAKVDAIPSSPKYTDTVYDDTAVKNRLSAAEKTESIALSVVSSRLTGFSYAAKYYALLNAVFVRVYGTVNADLNTGYDYNILNIGSRLPEATAALAVKCNKNAMAFAKSDGTISVRPLESGIKGYDIYITGLWFV